MSASPTSSRRLPAACFLGVAAVVLLGIAGAGGVARRSAPSAPVENGASREASDPGLSGGAAPWAAFRAQEPVRPAPGPTDAPAPTATRAPEGGVEVTLSSSGQRDARLVAARIQDHHRPFCESLSTP